MDKYYVYGLIDPRTDSIFYIGKGKGKRVYEHVKERESIHSNTDKLKVINEIKEKGLEVKYIIIGDNLSEESAFLLEKLLVYRIGRKIFDEGPLTNIVPGGKWHKEASLFIKNESLPTIEKIKQQYPELIPILTKYPHTAKKFVGLRCSEKDDNSKLYVFDTSGEKIYEWDIDYFMKIFGLGHALELINVIKTNYSPVYAWDRIWSKCKYVKAVDVTKIPFQEFDLIDFEFVNKINELILNNNNGVIDCYYMNGEKHAELAFVSNRNEVSLTYYFPNGNKKHFTSYLNGKLNGKCISWYPNGQVKEKVEYSENKCLGRIKYFQSGNTEMIENFYNDGTGKDLHIWYENGNIKEILNEDGTSFSYTDSGVLIAKSIRKGDINNGGYLMSWEYLNNGKIKKETKTYYLNGLLHGYEKSYYDTGELRREVDYTNGFDKKVIKSYKKNGEFKTKKTATNTAYKSLGNN